MVTPSQTVRTPPPPLPDDYVCPDPEPWEMSQGPTIAKMGYFVARHFSGQRDTLVRPPFVVNYDPYDMNRRIEPDLCVAFGVDVAAIDRRNGFIIWEVGKPPDFVMEVASESTHERDTGFKRDLYASLKIQEYWRVDPTGGDFYGCPLAGEMLVDGQYRPIPVHTESDGMVWGYSPTLDLCLCWHPAWDWDIDDASNLRFYDRKTQRYLCDMTLVEEALAAEQAARVIAESARHSAEARLNEAVSARQSAEASRQSAEAQLNEAEASRQAAEASRQSAEAQRDEAQAAQAAAEARLRQLEEQIRQQSAPPDHP